MDYLRSRTSKKCSCMVKKSSALPECWMIDSMSILRVRVLTSTEASLAGAENGSLMMSGIKVGERGGVKRVSWNVNTV